MPLVAVAAAALSVGVAAGSQTPPGVIRAELTVPGTGVDRWTLEVFRQRGSGTSSGERISGSIDYCLSVSRSVGEGARRERGRTCVLSTSIAIGIARHGLSLDCGGVGIVLGKPAPPAPTCGLVAAGVRAVTVAATDAPTVPAALSEPFRVRYNRSPRILRRSGVDPGSVRTLPRTFRVRAFLAFVPTPATPPGARMPRLTVTAVGSDGSTHRRRVGGDLLPIGLSQPFILGRHAPKDAPQTRLARRGADGRLWRSTHWRTRRGGLCATVSLAGRGWPFRSGQCTDAHTLSYSLEGGSEVYSGGPGRGRRRTYPVYGFARSGVRALTIIDPRGRRSRAALSPVFTTVRGIRVRAFLAAVRAPLPEPGQDLEVESRLSNGYTESTGGGTSPGVGDGPAGP